MEDQLRAKDEVREQLSAAEKRSMALNGELEELRTQLEMSERSRTDGRQRVSDVRVTQARRRHARHAGARPRLRVVITRRVR